MELYAQFLIMGGVVSILLPVGRPPWISYGTRFDLNHFLKFEGLKIESLDFFLYNFLFVSGTV